MDTNKMRDISREQFEAKFPVPAGMAWKQAIGMYEVVDAWKLGNTFTPGKYNWQWEGWKASREAVVVELPEGLTLNQLKYGSVTGKPEHERWLTRPGAVRAIEAQGLKVAP